MLLAVSAQATDYAWEGGSLGAGLGTWFTGTDWNPDAPAGGPGSSDNVTISTGTCTLDVSTTVISLTISGSGRLQRDASPRNLTVTGDVNASGTGRLYLTNLYMTAASADETG